MIVSISLDNKKGGIANSLISYSKALEMIHEEHWIILPSDASVIQELSKISNVKICSMSKNKLRLHSYTRFFFHQGLKKIFETTKWIFVHNSKLLKFLKGYHNKIGLINHSGKMRNILHNACNIFITNQGMKRFLTRYPDNCSKNVVIPHGFDTSLESVNSRISQDNLLRIISAGRFVEKKGFLDLIEAAAILEYEKFSVQIKLFGSGALEKTLTNRIKTLGLTNIEVMGWTSSLTQEFLAADIFCIPSHEEPFGLIIGEAMLSGLPVVSTKTDGGLEILGSNPENRGGLLVNINDPAEIKNALIRLQNKELRTKLSNNAKENIRTNFSLEKLSTNLKSLIDDAA